MGHCHQRKSSSSPAVFMFVLLLFYDSFGPKTDKTPSKTNKVKKRTLFNKNTIYTFSVKLCLAKLQKQMRSYLIFNIFY